MTYWQVVLRGDVLAGGVHKLLCELVVKHYCLQCACALAGAFLLFLIDQNNFSELFHEFDTVLCSLLEPDDLYGLVDAISLLWRLNVAGVEAGEERWKKITDVCAQHVENCTFTWSVGVGGQCISCKLS